MQLDIFYYIWKLLYIFLVVLPPIIRRIYSCIYSIWYWSHRTAYGVMGGGTTRNFKVHGSLRREYCTKFIQ